MKYQIKANRTPADVLKNNDITLEENLTIEEAKIASIELQKTGEFVAVWIEEEAAPRIVRQTTQDFRGNKYKQVFCDNWAV